jgi:hypothetical protein
MELREIKRRQQQFEKSKQNHTLKIKIEDGNKPCISIRAVNSSHRELIVTIRISFKEDAESPTVRLCGSQSKCKLGIKKSMAIACHSMISPSGRPCGSGWKGSRGPQVEGWAVQGEAREEERDGRERRKSPERRRCRALNQEQ